MTRQELAVLFKGMKTVWPSSKNLDEPEALSIWYKLLQDLPYEAANAAVLRHMATSKFPPTIADIREGCAGMQQEGSDWLAGWSEVQRAIRRYGYMRPQEALDSVRAADPVAAITAERMGWQTLCESENQVADRANFRAAYETMTKRERERATLPPSVYQMLQEVGERMRLESRPQEPRLTDKEREAEAAYTTLLQRYLPERTNETEGENDG